MLQSVTQYHHTMEYTAGNNNAGNSDRQRDLKPGDRIAESVGAVVYQDKDNPHKVIKKIIFGSTGNIDEAIKNYHLFKKYYGENSAYLLKKDDCCYIHMDKLSGETLDKTGAFPDNAEEFFIKMLREMEAKGIYHANLKPDNVLYCARENRFYPLGFSDNSDLRRSATHEEYKVLDQEYKYRINLILDIINNRTIDVSRTDEPPVLVSGVPSEDLAEGELSRNTNFSFYKFLSGYYCGQELNNDIKPGESYGRDVNGDVETGENGGQELNNDIELEEIISEGRELLFLADQQKEINRRTHSSTFASVINNKGRVILASASLLGMAAGAYYFNENFRHDGENRGSSDAIISNEEYQQGMELINSLEGSDLDFIFSDSKVNLTPHIRMKRDNLQQETIDLEIKDENIPVFIEAILTGVQDVKIKEVFREIWDKNKNVSGKVRGSENLKVLLGVLNGIIVFLLNNKNTISDGQFSDGRNVVKALWSVSRKAYFPVKYKKLIDKIDANKIFITSSARDISYILDFIISDIKDVSFKREMESISKKAYHSLNKLDNYNQDDENLYLLMEHVSLLTEFSTDFYIKHGASKTYKMSVKLIKKLWKLADSLPELNSKHKIKMFAEYRQMIQSGDEVLSTIENLAPPIFDPNSYIDNFIDDEIRKFEKISGKKLGLKADSIIHATRHVHKYDAFVNQTVIIKLDIPLRDIVTNMYFMRVGQVYNLSYDSSIKPLIESLKKTHLQNKMTQALHDYKKEESNIKAMTTHYRQMIDYRCLSYLSPSNKDNKYASYVEGFLKGKVQAREFLFYNIKLNGVFFIPAGNIRKGVLFSIDEPKFFNLDDFHHKFIINGYMHTGTYTSTPRDPAFKAWILNKIPIKDRAEYGEETKPFGYPLDTTMLLAMPPIENHINHYLTPSDQGFNIKGIPDKLFSQLMERLESDIDTLNFSIEEMDAHEREKIFRVIKIFFAAASLIIAPVSGFSSTAACLGFIISAIDVAVSLAEGSIAKAKGDKNADTLMNEAIISSLMSVNFQARLSFNAPMITRNLISASVKNYQNISKLSKNIIPVILKNRAKYANMVKYGDLSHRGMSPKLVKPKMSDFTNEHGFFNELEFNKSMNEYIKEKGVLERMVKAGKNAPDERQRRKLIAESKMMSLRGSHSCTLDTVTDNRFTLHYVKDSPADTAVLSAHGWFTVDSTQLTLSGDKEILFLGPHGEILLEPPEVEGMLPMENLLSGKKNPSLYSKLTNKGLISYKPGSSLLNEEVAMNYKLSYYEKAPDEEMQLALLSNRINKNKERMDIITVNEKVDSDRYRDPTLRDLMALIKNNKSFQPYKKILFVACREEKTPGLLRKSVKDVKLGSGYEVEFSEKSFAEQSTRNKRSTNHTSYDDDINFDGFLLYELITLEKGKMTREIKEIVPYIKSK
ncbi:putative adhesin [Erwinia psidii]|uniref:Protein kinase domain-containing protein n=1 Tax=Erwinia psidii TaxID=69224 RepID=A0A3N6SG19_9GAMM|nr:hypothetical protein [Erwinia psidii]RQM36496.1 hypothetical protein EB241_19955 [Erwinia psidii]